jgi:hypothetical protein
VLRLLAPLHLVLSLIIVVWDVVLAGRIARVRDAPKPFAALSGVAALLLAPALLIHVGTSTLITGRGVAATDWLWPVMLLVFFVHALWAVARKLVNPAWGLPILAYNGVIAVVGVVRFLVAHGVTPPQPLLTLLTAQSIAMTIGTWSPLTMVLPFYVNPPMISPAFPAMRRATVALRALMSTIAVAWLLLIFAGLPRAIASANGSAQVEETRDRPKGDFRVGLKILPDAANPPSLVASRRDLALADTMGVNAYTFVIVPGASRLTIDSLARIVDRVRGDSTTIIVAIGYRGVLMPELGRVPLDPAARIATITRAVERLKPNILLPAEDPYGIGARAVGHLQVETWKSYLTAAAAASRAANPATRIGVSIAEFGPSDSSLYAWAAGRNSPVDVIGFSFFPAGLVDVATYQRAADRWMQETPSDKEHWVFAVGGYPLAYGEAAQERLILNVLAWATDHPHMKGAIVYEAGDYGEARGLRAPNGRLRSSAMAVARAIRALRESIQP